MIFQDATKSRFPQELFDMTIDYLHADKKALTQCSLVCKDWVPSSSLHLFERIRWPPCHSIWVEAPNGVSSNTNSPTFPCNSEDDVASGFTTLLAFVSCTPRLWRGVEELMVSSRRCPSSRMRAEELLSSDLLLSIFDHLPRLRIVTLSDCRWQVNPGMGSTRRRVTRTVTAKIHNQKLQDMDNLNFISCFRHIDSLVVCNQHGGSHFRFLTPSYSFPVRVDSLSVANHSNGCTRLLLDDALPSLLDIDSIRSITLSKPPGYYIEKSLRNLIKLEQLDFPVFHVPRHSLNIFPYLRSLTVRATLCASSARPWSYAWPALIGTFVQCATPTVTTIGIGLRLYGSCQCGRSPRLTVDEIRAFLVSLNWQPLCSAIAKYDSLQLISVIVGMEGSLDMADCLETVREVVDGRLQVPGGCRLEVVEGHEIDQR